jgi:Protein of unknown function (DUF551)
MNEDETAGTCATPAPAGGGWRLASDRPERLPDSWHSRIVLVWCSGHYRLSYCYGASAWADHLEGGAWADQGVTHWRDLPAPPEGPRTTHECCPKRETL